MDEETENVFNQLHNTMQNTKVMTDLIHTTIINQHDLVDSLDKNVEELKHDVQDINKNLFYMLSTNVLAYFYPIFFLLLLAFILLLLF